MINSFGFNSFVFGLKLIEFVLIVVSINLRVDQLFPILSREKYR